jgi:hypothetical protein
MSMMHLCLLTGRAFVHRAEGVAALARFNPSRGPEAQARRKPRSRPSYAGKDNAPAEARGDECRIDLEEDVQVSVI